MLNVIHNLQYGYVITDDVIDMYEILKNAIVVLYYHCSQVHVSVSFK